jgi:hypothetical protein
VGERRRKPAGRFSVVAEWTVEVVTDVVHTFGFEVGIQVGPDVWGADNITVLDWKDLRNNFDQDDWRLKRERVECKVGVLPVQACGAVDGGNRGCQPERVVAFDLRTLAGRSAVTCPH